MFSADQRRGRVPGGRAINQNKEQILEMFSIFHEISHYLLKYLSFYLIQGQEWANNCKLCNCNDGSQIDVFFMIYTND